jgi:hypothetical protein
MGCGPQMKVASFTVGASAEQSRRWKMAAEADGHRAVGSWLSEAADAYLKARERAGRPVPLAWHRGRFRVILAGGEEMSVQGMELPRFRGHLAPFLGERGVHDAKESSTVLAGVPATDG